MEKKDYFRNTDDEWKIVRKLKQEKICFKNYFKRKKTEMMWKTEFAKLLARITLGVESWRNKEENGYISAQQSYTLSVNSS